MNETRFRLAVALAPLCPTALIAIGHLVLPNGSGSAFALAVIFSLLTSYLGFIILGLPMIYCLRRYGLLSFTALIFAGAIGGMVAFAAFLFAFGLMLGSEGTYGFIELAWGAGLGLLVAVPFGLILGITRDSSISGLEKAILDCVGRQLPPELVTRWDQQIREINKIQRLPEGVEVNFYRMKNGRPTFDANLALPNKSEELLAAKVYLSLPNSSQELQASVWCVKGFLFSIEYKGSAAYFAEASAVDGGPKVTMTCELVADLSKS